MWQTILLSTVVSLTSIFASAGVDELDQNQGQTSPSIEGTIILRLDNRTGEMSMVELDQVVSTESEAQSLIHSNFASVPQGKIRTELDREAGASSWYWYYPGYNYGYSYGSAYYYANGYCYNPWFNFSFGFYTYSYFNRFSRFWW